MTHSFPYPAFISDEYRARETEWSHLGYRRCFYAADNLSKQHLQTKIFAILHNQSVTHAFSYSVFISDECRVTKRVTTRVTSDIFYTPYKGYYSNLCGNSVSHILMIIGPCCQETSLCHMLTAKGQTSMCI